MFPSSLIIRSQYCFWPKKGLCDTCHSSLESFLSFSWRFCCILASCWVQHPECLPEEQCKCVLLSKYIKASLFLQNLPSNGSLAELLVVLCFRREHFVVHHYMVTTGGGKVQYCLDTLTLKRSALKVKTSWQKWMLKRLSACLYNREAGAVVPRLLYMCRQADSKHPPGRKQALHRLLWLVRGHRRTPLGDLDTN